MKVSKIESLLARIEETGCSDQPGVERNDDKCTTRE